MIPEVGEKLREVYMITEVGEDLEDGVEKREEEVGVDPDPYEEDIEDVFLDDERERHWCMDFEDNNGRVDGKKALLHANM